MKRLAKVEHAIEDKLKKQAKRYNTSYPGEIVHFDTKRLPLLQNQKATDPRDDLFVAIDDFSREFYAAILPDRTAAGAAKLLLLNVIDCCPYTVECAYSDNGVEYRGNAGSVRSCLRTKQYRTKIYPHRPTADQRQSRTGDPHTDGDVARSNTISRCATPAKRVMPLCEF